MVFHAEVHDHEGSGGDIEMGPPHLSGMNSFKAPGLADKPHRSLLEGRRDLCAPSEAGYTSDATDFTDFSDEEGSEIDLDSPAEQAPGNLVEFSADSIGETWPVSAAFRDREPLLHARWKPMGFKSPVPAYLGRRWAPQSIDQ